MAALSAVPNISVFGMGGNGESSTFVGMILLFTKIGVGFAGIIGLLLYHYQDNLLYIPNPPNFPVTPNDNPVGFRSPNEWNKQAKTVKRYGGSPIDFEDHILDTPDGVKLHAWLLLNKDSENVPTLIYFHGNAGNMGFRLKNAAEMYALVGINILMMDYRGYGASTGTPNEKGLNIDADTVLKFVKSHPKLINSPVLLFGRSLGGAVCVSLAKRYPDLVDAVILENTFLSVSAMVDRLMPYVAVFKSLILRIKWNSDELIGDLKQPIMFISGDSDQLVPPSHMKGLHERAKTSRFIDFFSVGGGTHNDTWEVAGVGYYLRMRQFIEFGKIGRANAQCDAVGVADRSTSSIPTMKTDFSVK